MVVRQLSDLTKDRVSIVMEDGFSFVLYKGELRLYGINVGKEIPHDAYEEIMNTVLPKRAKLRAMNLLKVRPYTEKVLRDKLSAGGYPPEIIDVAIDYVASYHYVDDRQYAEDFIYTYKERKNKKRIMTELMNKGVSKDIIEEAFENFRQEDDTDYEKEQILSFLRKKNYSSENFDYQARNKLLASLYRKGYSVELARKLMNMEE